MWPTDTAWPLAGAGSTGAGRPAAAAGRPAGSQRPGPVTSPAGVGCPTGPGGTWTTGLRSGWGAVSLVCTK